MKEPEPSRVTYLLHATSAGGLRLELRDGLRAARSAVLADAEGFEVIVYAIERVGRNLLPSRHSLNDYAPALLELAGKALAPSRVSLMERELFLLRQSRNDRMHIGSHARDAAAMAVRVALALEEALSVGWRDMRLRDVMTAHPVVANSWATLADVRHQMLANAFTTIPAWVGERWYLLTDAWLAEMLCGLPSEARSELLRKTVDDVHRDRKLPDPCVPHEAEDPIAKLAGSDLRQGLILVSDPHRPDSLLGVLAPADIL